MALMKLFTYLLMFWIKVRVATGVCEKPVSSPHLEFKSVCYPYVGCFDDRPPFNNAIGSLPRSPKELQVEFRLYTRQNTDTMELLDYTNASALTSSHFLPQKDTKFVIHGFSNTADSPWITLMKDALLRRGDFNVITVNWGEGAKLPDYNQAVANLRLVATQVKLLLDIFEGHGLDLGRLHLIGHSLGAHMSGYVGLLMGSRIGRITGMDPAEPDFECLPTLVRLDAGDARFVDVIHTNGEPIIDGGAGLFQQSGHVDFYVNGGKTQPGCKDGLSGALGSLFSHGGQSLGDDVSCSHARSHDIFTESINTHCPFTAFPCDNYDKYSQGNCFTCGQSGCSSMGYFADEFEARGKMFLNTRQSAPYCGYQYAVTIQTSETTKSTKGTLYAALTGSFGTTHFEQISPKDEQLQHNTTVTFVGSFTSEVGHVTSVKLKYKKYAGMGFGFFRFGAGADSFSVQSAHVTSAETGSSFELCKGDYELKHEEEVMITTHNPTDNCPSS